MQKILQYHYQIANINKNKLDTQENRENKCLFIRAKRTLFFLSISVSGIIAILSTSVMVMIHIQNQMAIQLPHGQAGPLQILPFFVPIHNLH